MVDIWGKSEQAKPDARPGTRPDMKSSGGDE
jgi:hypothetical protein